MSGFSFGSTNTGSGFTFGSSTGPAGSGGFALGSFGAGTSTQVAPSTTAPAALGFSSSLFAQKPTTGFGFSSPAAGSVTTTASSGFSLGFGKPAASATPFSLTTTTSATPGLGLGSVLTSAVPQTGSTGFSLNLGGTATTTSAPAPGFSFGTSLFSGGASTGLGQSSLGGGLNLGGLGSTSTASTTPAPSLGLGGVDFSTSSEKNNDKSSGIRPEDSKALKDENLPGPICQDVDNFQKFVKEQKQVQEEISRMSSKSILKVQEDIKTLRQLLSVCASGLQRNSLSIDKLKIESSQELKSADIALRTQKTPPGLQHENTAPSDYFRALVEMFEVQLQQYRQQIEELENHLTTQSSGAHITPQDLSLAMQKLYQTFVALAAQLQGVHENVKTLKHQYLSYRRTFLDDSTDVFQSKRASGRKWHSSTRVTTGPAPFGTIPNAAAVAMAATLSQQQQPAPGPQGSSFGPTFSGIGTNMGSSGLGAFAGGSGFGGLTSFGFSSSKPSGGSLSAGFGTSNTSGFNFSNPGINASAGLTFGVSNTQAQGFGAGGPLLQLKKPPAGNKRGKR